MPCAAPALVAAPLTRAMPLPTSHARPPHAPTSTSRAQLLWRRWQYRLPASQLRLARLRLRRLPPAAQAPGVRPRRAGRARHWQPPLRFAARQRLLLTGPRARQLAAAVTPPRQRREPSNGLPPPTPSTPTSCVHSRTCIPPCTHQPARPAPARRRAPRRRAVPARGGPIRFRCAPSGARPPELLPRPARAAPPRLRSSQAVEGQTRNPAPFHSRAPQTYFPSSRPTRA